MRRLAVVNMKGGVGKTTTAVHVAAGFARAGRRVLLVDADPQGNVAHVFGLTAVRTIADLMTGAATALECVVPRIRPNLDVIASAPSAFALDARLASEMQRETILARRLRGVTDYDVLVIDSSPSMTLLTYNALLAAGEIVVPVAMDPLAVTGARQTLDGVEQIRALWPDRRLTLRAVVPTSVNPQTLAARAAYDALAADPDMAPAVFTRGIRQCLDLTYAAAARQTIWEYAPRSRAAEDYTALIETLDGSVTLPREMGDRNGQENAAVL